MWLVAGIAFAMSGVVARLPPLAPMWVAGSVAGWTLAYRRSCSVRDWARGIDLRAIMLGHALRLPIGAVFLYEASQGRLAPMFANTAGSGDIVVGALALATTLALPAITVRRVRIVRAFTWFALIDICVALGTGMYLLLVVGDPTFVVPFARLPFPLLPGVIVPLVITTHLLTLARLRGSRSDGLT
ncbi:MAG: hypothetical protein WKG01_07945 [Kofleriaceae bacterium]